LAQAHKLLRRLPGAFTLTSVPELPLTFAMVQMRALIVLGGLFLASADTTSELTCALQGSGAVDELLDSAIYMWAATKRCAETGEGVRCEVNIASAVESVNGMINVIVKALESCGHLKSEKIECGQSVGRLTESIAGLTAASGGVIATCPNKLEPRYITTVRGSLAKTDTYGESTEGFGACMVDVKATMKSLFHAIKRLMTLEEHCEDPHSEKCTHNVLKVVDSFASIGEMIASALNHCTVCQTLSQGGSLGCEKMRMDADCAAESTRLVDEVNNVARAAVGMDEHCGISKGERLFLDDDEDTIATGTGGTSVTLGLVALLPLTAVVAFMGGSRIAKTRGEFKRGNFEFSPMAQEVEQLVPMEA